MYSAISNIEMGKKKKKSSKTPHDHNNNSNVKNDGSSSHSTINAEASNGLNHSVSTFPPPSLAKEVFIILSLCGHLNAAEYSGFLDEVEDGHNNDGSFHSDDEMDDIILAMDIYEQERQPFASSLHSIATSLLELIKNSASSSKRKRQSLSSPSPSSTEPTTIHIESMETFEDSCFLFHQNIIAYKKSLHNQRNCIIKCHQNIVNIILQTNTKLLSPVSASASASASVSIDYTNSSNIEKIHWLNESKVKYKSLIDEFRHQLQWENIVLAKLEEILSNGCLYSWFCDDNNNNNTNDNVISSSKQFTISLCKDMLQWSSAVGSCSLLSKTKFVDVKDCLLLSLVNNNQYNLTDTSSMTPTRNNNNNLNMSHRNKKDKQQLLKIDHSTDDPETTLMNQMSCLSFENDRGDAMKWRRQKVLSSTTIEDAMNTFLGKNILTVLPFGQPEKQEHSPSRGRSREVAQQKEYMHEKLAEEKDNGNNDNLSAIEKWKILQSATGPIFFLLVGSPNSGKTYFCNKLGSETHHHDFHIKVLHPKLPGDLLGPTVGHFEDSLLSLFAYATQLAIHGTKCIVILDNIEHILGQSFGEHSTSGNVIAKGISWNESENMIRIRGTFLGIIYQLKSRVEQNVGLINNLAVVCTARSQGDDKFSDCFDKIYHLKDPGWEERRHIVKESLGLPILFEDNEGDEEDTTLNHLLATIATSSTGKSRGEIALYCREAINTLSNCDGSTDCDDIDEKRRLHCINSLGSILSSMQSVTPDSIKQLSNNESIEMRVLSSKELQKNLPLDDEGNITFPLVGQNAYDAWKQLQNTIITPLCQADTLDEVLYGNVKGKGDDILSKKSITCGVLITGAPGVGKSAIAYHCAAYASKLEPTLRLLDVSCTSLISKQVGGSERNISKLFQIARSSAPCIVLLDGIENIGQVRGNDNTTEGTMDRLLSTLLIEMDGVTNSSESSTYTAKGIAVIGITHNPPSWIDPALQRPGRLEKNINLQVPDIEARKDILKNEMKDISIDFTGAGYFDPKDERQLWEHVSMKTGGKSAAEVIAIGKNARIAALRRSLDKRSTQEGTKVRFSDFMNH